MQEYDYALKPLNGALLSEQLTALAISGFGGWSIRTDGQIGVYFALAISAGDKTRLNAIIASHDSAQPSSTGILADGRTAAQQAADAQDTTDHATLAAFDTALANYIALATPTAAQTAASVQAQAKAWRYLARRLQRLGLI